MKDELGRLMADRNLDGFLVMGDGHGWIMRYLTGGAYFEGAALLQRADGPLTLIHGAMERDSAAATGLKSICRGYAEAPTVIIFGFTLRACLARSSRSSSERVWYRSTNNSTPSPFRTPISQSSGARSNTRPARPARLSSKARRTNSPGFMTPCSSESEVPPVPSPFRPPPFRSPAGSPDRDCFEDANVPVLRARRKILT